MKRHQEAIRNTRDSIRSLASSLAALAWLCLWLAPGPARAANTTVGDWSFLNSQNPGWSVQRTYTLTANGIQLGAVAVGEGMMSIAKPAGMSFANSGVEMIFTGTNAVGNNENYAYISMYRDGGNPPRIAYGITATDFTSSGGQLTSSVNNGTSGGEIITSTALANANFVGKHAMALVRFDDNTPVTLASNRGATDTTSPASGTSNGSGVLTFTAMSSSAGAAVFTATDTTDSLTLSQTATVTFTAGAVSASASSVSAAPASVLADGSTPATVTVTLKDSNTNPIAGKTVTLASSRSSADTISAASGQSNISGVVTFTVKSATPGTSVYTATDSTDGIGVNPTTSVDYVDGTAKDILSCNFGALGAATIDGTSIVLSVPPSQDRTSLAPTFTISP